MRTSRLTKACNERGGFHARATPRRMKRVHVSDMGLNQRDSTACFYIRNNNDARERERAMVSHAAMNDFSQKGSTVGGRLRNAQYRQISLSMQ